MKKLIAVLLLLVVLIAGGLGSLAYAQEDANNVHVFFSTRCNYSTSEDSFINGEVTGNKFWESLLINSADPGAPDIINAVLSLDSGLDFVWFQPEPNTMGPPIAWEFGDIPEILQSAAVNSNELVTFIPGFNASRSASQTVFSEPTIQTLTITMTPTEEASDLKIFVMVSEDDNVVPVITSPTTDEEEGLFLVDDGTFLSITITEPVVGDAYIYEVTIEVTPKVAELEFMPNLLFGAWHYSAPSTQSGSSVGYTMPEVGTWTWSAEGSYEWHWQTNTTGEVGLGGYSIDMQQPGNQIFAHFSTSWDYYISGNTFTNKEVTGWKRWLVILNNPADASGAPVNGLNLRLDTELAFDGVGVFNGNLETEGPPVYEWSFNDVAEGASLAEVPHVNLQFWGVPHPFPVTFTPGFNASRIADKTEFLQSEGTQTQALTISLTPLEQQVAEGSCICVQVPTWIPGQGYLVDAVINPPTGVEFSLTADKQRLWIWPMGLTVGEEWTTTITIEVTPKVPEVEFMPSVHISSLGSSTYGTDTGSSLSRPVGDPADNLGTWTWNAAGSYIWDWREGDERAVGFDGFCENITEPIPHEPMTGQKLVATGEFGTVPGIVQADIQVSFTNPDCVSEITIDRVSIIRDDGGVLYEGPLSGLNYIWGPYVGDVLGPHQTVIFFLRQSIPDGNGGWLSEGDALAMPLHTYTVEIFYSVSKKRGLPLIGRVTQLSAFPGNDLEAIGIWLMVNMEQRLKPKK
jgi:hypothetical protein